MRVDAPTISKLRLQRYHRWALLWLKWFAAFLDAASFYTPLSAQAGAVAHQWLDRIERTLVYIILLRAMPMLRATRQPRPSTRRRIDSHLLRAMVGSALRRALRFRDLSRRIEALSQDIEVLVARMRRRLRRGLTRRRPFIARPEMRAPEPSLVGLANAASAADTS